MSFSCGTSGNNGDHKASFRLSSDQDGSNNLMCTEGSAGIKHDSLGSSAEAKITSSVYRYSDGDEDLKLLNSKLGVKAGANVIDGLKAKCEVHLDLLDYENGGFKSRVGLNADTGGSIGPEGVEAKVAGIGFKLGKEIGVSMPFGEVSFDLGKLNPGKWFD
ncbi:hypothetical protein RclHR1_14160002 [Rhizophagus clarus]|uniref:Uncharacterized protein n=1 Tax=Rhizophagus clarus TaxID=94130 RepID=A0A2Z6R4G9_9GLOM|nr:hypothetical protein RclHR1_14160002 [Rhizophagus clarus]GES84993.1 hypothetical protein GLOIN_2v1586964 [Rhizophagus clarus]